MPSWGEIGAEIAAVSQIAGAPSPFDTVRRKYLATVHALTGRAVICYASRWTVAGPPSASPELLSISNSDVPAFMEALYGLAESELDLILHSPGGSAEAADAIVSYLRSKFRHIRIFVPHMAMSAATMLCCAADEIVMGKHSFIGPIDPQITLVTGLGIRQVAAQAIIDQFTQAVVECNDVTKVRAWLPMLAQYGPDLLVTCENANKLSKTLVSNWLERYMFAGQADASDKASSISAWMADHNEFKTHGKPISRDAARDHGMRVIDLEQDQALQDAILSVFHSLTHVFAQWPHVSKVVENHNGRAFIVQSAPQTVVFPMQFPPSALTP